MTVAEFILILFIAFIFSMIFVYALSAKGPWGSFWTFFLVLLLGLWAAGLWLQPVGPLIFGAPWISLLAVGLVLALLLAAASSPSDKRERREKSETAEATSYKPDTAASVSAVFWLIITVFAIVIIIGAAF